MSEEKSPRERIVETAVRLLEVQGYHATGLKQIVKESEAPMGSVYHYFPSGKESIASEAVERSQRVVAKRIQDALSSGDSFTDGLNNFIMTLAKLAESPSPTDHGSIVGVSMESPNVGEQLRMSCEGAYRRWQTIFYEALVAADYPPDLSHDLATVITAGIQGGLVLSRVQQSGEPLRSVARMLVSLVEKEQPK